MTSLLTFSPPKGGEGENTRRGGEKKVQITNPLGKYVDFDSIPGLKSTRGSFPPFRDVHSQLGIIFVYSIGDRSAFQTGKIWMKVPPPPPSLLSLPFSHPPFSHSRQDSLFVLSKPLLILANKLDLHPDYRQVTEEEGRAFAKECGAMFFEVTSFSSFSLLRLTLFRSLPKLMATDSALPSRNSRSRSTFFCSPHHALLFVSLPPSSLLIPQIVEESPA